MLMIAHILIMSVITTNLLNFVELGSVLFFFGFYIYYIIIHRIMTVPTLEHKRKSIPQKNNVDCVSPQKKKKNVDCVMIL